MSNWSDEDLKMLQYAKAIQKYCANKGRCKNCIFNTKELEKDPEYDAKYYICALQKDIAVFTPTDWMLNKIDIE